MATTTAVLFLALATRPITESETAMYDVSRAQAFAHEQLGRSDIAVRIYEGICNKGSGSACSAAGVIFRDGHDLPANSSRARGLFAQGCEAHDWRSCRDLGKLFLSGLGGPQNPTRATDLFHKARRIRAGH
jgi:TPR repeat protein